jgi:hypothetical protein
MYTHMNFQIFAYVSSNKRKTTTLDQCYDFYICSPKNSAKNGILTQNKAKLCKILVITLVFETSANFLPKIVENRRKL